ncbi:YisL family protein [Neobacillus vireti]|uniref:YisL family protein n=1 Tax=Neobacillus vireti TaxID=220686 RepID=UPI002FFDDE6C
MTHAHLTTLVLALIFLFIIKVLHNKEKNSKIWNMVLRASYILVYVIGCILFFASYSIPLSYYIKATLDIIMIGLFEMVIVRKQKENPQISFGLHSKIKRSVLAVYEDAAKNSFSHFKIGLVNNLVYIILLLGTYVSF